ncbi:unnamed protein product [Heligmosomoides polygyrus]|uniref:ADH_zinc_N domain-containing protein n=1 Tax=Heligmosomoides polygyrus TaxID=6339 RepID=A0A183GCG2_HELPZ|nr:unnamed protein product [Heligmosomoides polygyrus]
MRVRVPPGARVLIATKHPVTTFFSCSALILAGRGAVRFFTDEMDLGWENRGDDASILRKMAWGQVDVAIKEIGVEVGMTFSMVLLEEVAVSSGCRRAAILLLKLAKFRRALRMLNPPLQILPTLPPFSP